MKAMEHPESLNLRVGLGAKPVTGVTDFAPIKPLNRKA